MQLATSTPHQRARPSSVGLRRLASRALEPLFLADWDSVVFLHFEVDAKTLQPHVPFELDLFEDNRAFVSLVAFTMRGMRFKNVRMGRPHRLANL